LDLVADRFLVCDRDTTIDLASGERVQLIVSASGGVADQARWASRCDRFARLRHRSIAPLVDYGPLGDVRRFEAWRSDGQWCGSSHERDRVRSNVEEFLCANGWTSGAIDVRSIHQVNGRAMLLPDAKAGVDRVASDDKGHEIERLSSMAVLGLTEVADQRVAAMADIFTDRVGAPCTVVAVHGDRGSGHDNAVLNLARAARLRGYVPVASHLIRRHLRTVLHGRSVALFIRSKCANGWSAVLWLSLMSHKPHIAVFVGSHSPRGVAHITLSRMSAKTLELSVVPDRGLVQFKKQIATAARRAKGLPGRFEALMWGERDMSESFDEPKHSRVAESAAPYSRETVAITAL